MKRYISVLLLVLLIFSMISCSQQAESAETTEVRQPETKTTSAPAAEVPTTEMTEPGSSPSPGPEKHVPQDIFGSEFNPYADVDLPDIFNIFAASFSKGSAKMGGNSPYVLFMTASGDISEAIAFHANQAGLGDDEKQNKINEYLDNGFCQFKSGNGFTFTIRKTNPDDDRYEYAEGCLIEIEQYISTVDIEKYTNLARENYNLNAMSPLAEYLGAEPDWSVCDFSVNLHKNEARTSVIYHIADVDAAQQSIVENIKCDWHDEQNGSLGLTYGMLGIKIEFDSKGDSVYVTQTTSDFDKVLSDYIAPEVSLTKLGFGFDQDSLCGVYDQHEPHYMNVAIHRPEWGEFSDDWNIEYLDEVNGYTLRITYHASEDKYHITSDKNGTGAAFDYLQVSGG